MVTSDHDRVPAKPTVMDEGTLVLQRRASCRPLGSRKLLTPNPSSRRGRETSLVAAQ